MFRIGHGYDVHKLVEGRKLILGGIDIPHTTGLLGHSDADVLAHAIMDSMLGALALGDIGHLFPDTADEYEGADIDATVIAQAPKLATYILSMRENIARVCGVDVSQISVKATTEEHLGFTGEKLGISAHSVALMVKI